MEKLVNFSCQSPSVFSFLGYPKATRAESEKTVPVFVIVPLTILSGIEDSFVAAGIQDAYWIRFSILDDSRGMVW